MRVKVLILDGTPDNTGETFDPAGVRLPAGAVPVQYGFQDNIESCFGWAKLERVGDAVYADLDIVLGRQEQTEQLYPAVCGVVLDKRGSLIKTCEIRSIGVNPTPNADPRIGRIVDQLKDCIPCEG